MALKKATLNADDTQNLDEVYVSPDADAYALSSYSYMIVPTKDLDPAKGDVLGSFMAYFACEGQRKADQLGYAPLPAEPRRGRLQRDAERSPAHRRRPAMSECTNPTITGGNGGTSDDTAEALSGGASSHRNGAVEPAADGGCTRRRRQRVRRTSGGAAAGGRRSVRGTRAAVGGGAAERRAGATRRGRPAVERQRRREEADAARIVGGGGRTALVGVERADTPGRLAAGGGRQRRAAAVQALARRRPAGSSIRALRLDAAGLSGGAPRLQRRPLALPSIDTGRRALTDLETLRRCSDFDSSLSRSGR